MARSRAARRRQRLRRAWSRRKATFCQTVRLSKSAPPWNSMPKWRRKARRSMRGERLAVDQDLAGVVR